jgi:hypothetical protein
LPKFRKKRKEKKTLSPPATPLYGKLDDDDD